MFHGAAVAVPIRRINPDLLRIHAEDAGFVATQRALALEAPNYRLVDVYDLEQRLQGHLDGLVLAGAAGGEAARDLAEETGEGENAGVLLHVALRLGRRDLAEAALKLATETEGAEPHLGRAVAWCTPETLSGVMRGWIASREPLLRWVAFDVCGLHRVDPRDHLMRGLADPDRNVRNRAVRLAGELGRTDCLDAVRAAGGPEADLAAVFLGDHLRAERLAAARGFPDTPAAARRAAEVFPLVLGEGAAQAAIRDLLAGPATRRWGIVALGALGSAKVLPWLLQAMEAPLDARAAVSAFEQITGVYVAHEELELDEFPEPPENPVVDDDPTEALIEENTPWPDLTRMRAWLEENAARFPADERLLFGVAAWTHTGPPEPWLRFQSRFRAVALTQALRAPDAPCPNWHAPVLLRDGHFTRAW